MTHPAPDPSGSMLQSILDAVPYPVFYKDPQGKFVGCNRAFVLTRKLPLEQLLGKTVFDLLPPDEAARVARMDRELMDSGTSETFLESFSDPSRASRQVLIHKCAIRGADGKPAGLVTTLMDLTEQKAAEAALRQNQELLTTISSNVTDLMAILDAEGRRLFNTPSFFTILGYAREELEALSPLGLVHPDDLPVVRQALAEVFGRGIQQRVEHRLRHRNGAWLHFESKANPILPPAGKPVTALIVSRDVSERKAAELERKQMEVQLRHAQKLESIGSLAAGIAHEINTPIQYIGDNTAFLLGAMPDLLACLQAQRRHLRGLPDPPAETGALLARIETLDLDYLTEEIPKALRQTLDGVARVAAIVSAMKDFSHPGGEGKVLADLNKAIESTLTVSRNEWKYVARLETELDPELPQVPCLQGEINQAVLNLVVNAAHAIADALGGRHTGKLGLIRVATRRVGQEARISVSDSGQGIPEAIRERIFEPFFTTKPVGRGTGQGLAIVHAVVVEKHGGRVTLETGGQGTTFHLFLPLAEP